MATLRKWLTGAGVDWSNLVIVVHNCEGSKSPGWAEATASFKYDFRDNVSPMSDQVKFFLDHEFDSGSGAPQAPRFIADDGDFLYFPEQSNGETSLVKVSKNIDFYMNIANNTPYPGD